MDHLHDAACARNLRRQLVAHVGDLATGGAVVAWLGLVNLRQSTLGVDCRGRTKGDRSYAKQRAVRKRYMQ